MKLTLKIFWIFYLFMSIQLNNCYSQMKYEEFPDTLFHEYKNEREVVQIFKRTRLTDGTLATIPIAADMMHRRIPLKWKSTERNVKTKSIYKDCNNCIYQEYIDSIEIRPAYDKLFLKKEATYEYQREVLIPEEWAWVKIFEKIPEKHKPCRDVAGIDTCLWKYTLIKEAKIDTVLIRSNNHFIDTVKISPSIIPVKRYRLMNKSKAEIEALTLIDTETISFETHIVEEEERLISINGEIENITSARVSNRRILIKVITPLNYETMKVD